MCTLFIRIERLYEQLLGVKEGSLDEKWAFYWGLFDLLR